MNFSIIVPLYNEAENIVQLNEEILQALKEFKDKNHKFELIYVDDGSTDETLKILKQFNNKVDTKILKNNKNLSQSKSILNGIDVSNHNNIILLDGDLQNDPKDIVKMIKIYSTKENTLVHGYRKKRNDPYFTKILPSKIANFIVRKLTNSKIFDHGCSLKIFDKNIINVNDFFGDFHRLFAAQIDKEIDVIEIEVNHRPRIKGKSNYGFERIFKIFIDLLYIKFFKNDKSYFYSLGMIGLISFFLSILSFIYMLYLKLFLNTSFIATPMPVLVIFFALAGLIFFSIVLILETIKNLFKNTNKLNKNYKIISN